MVFIPFFFLFASTPSPPPYTIRPIPPCSNDQMHFLDFLCSSPYYPGANVLNSIATIHIQANLLSVFFFLKQLSLHKLWRAHLWSGDKSVWLNIYSAQASHPKTTLLVGNIFTEKVSTTHNQLLHIHKTPRKMVSEEKCTSWSVYVHK